MNSKIGRSARVILILGIGAFCAGAAAQDLRLANPTLKSLRVEYNYVFSVQAYEGTPVLPYSSAGRLPADSAERVLLEFFASMAAGDVDRGLTFWTKLSQQLIRRKNERISRDALIASARNTSNGLQAQLLNRLEYGPYVIVELQFVRPDRSVATKDSFALEKEDGVWRLTQALADDPVMCCWRTETGRIMRAGVPGGDFSKALREALK